MGVCRSRKRCCRRTARQAERELRKRSEKPREKKEPIQVRRVLHHVRAEERPQALSCRDRKVVPAKHQLGQALWETVSAAELRLSN